MAEHTRSSITIEAAPAEVMEVATNYRRFLTDLVTSASDPGDGQRLLDFGVGVGTHAEALRALGYDVSCVETDPAIEPPPPGALMFASSSPFVSEISTSIVSPRLTASRSSTLIPETGVVAFVSAMSGPGTDVTGAKFAVWTVISGSRRSDPQGQNP